MIRGWSAVYLRELLILKRRLPKLLPAWSVTPLLYLIAFGYAVGKNVTMDGRSYLKFLLPGLVAMTTMTQAFSISSEINIARFYWRIFDEIQAAPVSSVAYVLGETAAGMTRALLSSLLILALGLLFGVLAVGLAMHVKSHADQALLANFIITPMAFLGGTFFPLTHMPGWAQTVLELLPLTHAAKAIRAAALQQSVNSADYFVLTGGAGVACFLFAWLSVNKAKD